MLKDMEQITFPAKLAAEVRGIRWGPFGLKLGNGKVRGVQRAKNWALADNEPL